MREAELQAQLDCYDRDGYLVVPNALDAGEVAAINEFIDGDLIDDESCWEERGRVRLTVHALLSQALLDDTMRPPRLLPLLEAIMGPELCAEEHSIRIRPPNPDGELACNWHRDAERPDADIPYRTRYLSAVFYLSDVDHSTHTFSVIPESGQGDQLPALEEFDLAGAHHIEGAAGTAVLFNVSTLHAGNVRRSDRERRTIHIYCGRSSDRHLSNYTIFPRRLLQSPDPAVRRYYGRPNDITRLMLDRY